MRVLAIIAHPDDEALGCGGRLAKHADAGDEVTVFLPTRRCDPRGLREWDRSLRALDESCAILGAKAMVADPAIDETAAEPQVHRLHDLILPAVENADLVLTHWIGDVNQVHRGVSRAVEIATRPFRRRRDVSLFEIPTSSEQGFGAVGQPFSPTEFVVLTADQARRKVEAVRCYETEMAAGRRPEDIERRLRLRGAEIGADLAEAYVTARRYV
jgi:LmbE family N-acetylglucosaminyl deacetylase